MSLYQIRIQVPSKAQQSNVAGQLDEHSIPAAGDLFNWRVEQPQGGVGMEPVSPGLYRVVGRMWDHQNGGWTVIITLEPMGPALPQ